VVGTWAGLRPLIREGSVPASRVSREHLITVDPRGVIAIAGGKLTTYRRMAAQALEAAMPFLAPANPRPSETGRTPLPYTSGLAGEADLAARAATLATDFGIPRDCAEHLFWTYGGEAASVLGTTEGDRSLLERIHPALPFLMVEIPFACTHEMCLTLEDFLYRRSSMSLLAADQALAVAPEIAARMAPVLGWDAGRKQAEIDRIRELTDLHLAGCR
jgi:glycerol-3-phosphate dehydrogenase